MRSPRRARLAMAAIVALATVAALAVPVVAAAKPKAKLWTVSLSGSASTDASATVPYGDSSTPQLPAGCIAHNTTTYRLHASARITPRPAPTDLSPAAGIDDLYVTVVLSSLNASASDEVGGSWAVDPNYSPGGFTPQPVDPSVCVFKPFTLTQPCTFRNRKPSTTLHLTLNFPGRNSKAFLYAYGGSPADGYIPSPVHCPDGTDAANYGTIEGGDLAFLKGEFRTSMQTRAVLALRTGRSVSVSGTIVMPERIFQLASPSKPGNETLTYSLKVKRVR
jgi:hypothetical protein